MHARKRQFRVLLYAADSTSIAKCTSVSNAYPHASQAQRCRTRLRSIHSDHSGK